MYQQDSNLSLMAAFDALSKFFWLVCVAVLVFIYPPLLNLAMFGVILCCAIVLGRVRLRQMWRALAVILVLAVLFLLGGLFYGQGTPIFRMGPLVYTWEGLNLRGAAAARILNVMFASMVFVWVTNPRDLVTGLVRLGVPYRIAFTIFVGLNYIPILGHEMSYIRDAQRLRGLQTDRSLGGRWRSYQVYLVAVLIRSLRRAQTTAFALDSKAFGAYADRTYLNPFHWTAAGIVWLCLWLLIVIASLYAAFALHLWSGHLLAT